MTVTGTGRRETGLERGEHDQGQHDAEREVLAVGTAGLLARRAALEGLGLDDELPVTWTDLDLGWRAARAGLAHPDRPRGRRLPRRGLAPGSRDPGRSRAARTRTDRAGADPDPAGQRAARPRCPWSRSGCCWAPCSAPSGCCSSGPRARRGRPGRRPLGAAATRPGRGRRRARRATATVRARDVRPLLAPWWTPYRHGLDELSEIGAAVAGAVGLSRDGRTERPRRRGCAAARRPGWCLVLTGVALVGRPRPVVDRAGRRRAAPGTGRRPATGGALYGEAVHRVGGLTTVPAPPYLPPLAVLGTVLVGSASAAVLLLLLLGVPLAGPGAARFLRRLGAARPGRGLGRGDLRPPPRHHAAPGRRAGSARWSPACVLPWLAASALRLAARRAAGERWRAAWGTAVWLALGAAFAPLLWVLADGGHGAAARARAAAPGSAPAGTGAARAVGRRRRPAGAVERRPSGPSQGVSALLLEAGTPRSDLLPGLDPLDVLTGRAGVGRRSAPG